jgi:hypothetical protein
MVKVQNSPAPAGCLRYINILLHHFIQPAYYTFQNPIEPTTLSATTGTASYGFTFVAPKFKYK